MATGDDRLPSKVGRLPANSDFADACTRYTGLLADGSTFSSVSIEELLDADVLSQTVAALRKRYIPG